MDDAGTAVAVFAAHYTLDCSLNKLWNSCLIPLVCQPALSFYYHCSTKAYILWFLSCFSALHPHPPPHLRLFAPSRLPTRAQFLLLLLYQGICLWFLPCISALHPHPPHTFQRSFRSAICGQPPKNYTFMRAKLPPYHVHLQQSVVFPFTGLAALIQTPPISTRHCVAVLGNRLGRSAYPRSTPFDRESHGEGYSPRGHRFVLGSVQAWRGASRWVAVFFFSHRFGRSRRVILFFLFLRVRCCLVLLLSTFTRRHSLGSDHNTGSTKSGVEEIANQESN